VLVAYTCNPRYSGGRDQEDHGSQPARQIVQEILSRKYSTEKRAGKSGSSDRMPAYQVWSSEFKHQKKKENKTKKPLLTTGSESIEPHLW
jgi:hypothetical protein